MAKANRISETLVYDILKEVGIISSNLEVGSDGTNLWFGELFISGKDKDGFYSRKELYSFIGYFQQEQREKNHYYTINEHKL